MQKLNTLLGLFLVLLFSAQSAAHSQVSFGNAEKFTDGWVFSLQDDPAAKNIKFDDTKWEGVAIPHDWSIKGELSTTLSSCSGYLPAGIGWYRKTFTINNDSPLQYIYFEGVYNRSEVYLNGHLLGSRPSGFVSFMYDMTPYLNLEGENVLSVRVDRSLKDDCRWYTGSGIYRDVWVVSAQEVHIGQWGLSYRAEKFEGTKATVAVDVTLDNTTGTSDALSISVSLKDTEGKTVASKSTKALSGFKGEKSYTMNLTVKDVQRWDLDTPYLYTLCCEVKRGGKVVDYTETAAGLRELTFDPNNGFALNGEWMNIKGVCLHQDAGVFGVAVPDEVWQRRLRALKELGVNSIRMSHNPQAPIVYQICDEIGLLVKDEAFDEWVYAKRKWMDGWNNKTAGYQGNNDFFAEWCERDVKDMVRRNRNHPSIFMWSIGNEIDYPNDPYSHPILDGSKISQPMYGGYNPSAPDAMDLGRISGRLAECVRSEDTSRPVTAALAGVVMSNETDYPSNLDVVGYNYTESRYALDHEKYPKRVIYGSENGASYKSWKYVRDLDYIFAQYLWTGADYLGEAGVWPSRGSKNGLVDVASQIKPRGYFRSSLWLDEPVTYVGSYIPNPKVKGANTPYSMDAWDVWNYEEGEIVRVVCYTNAPQARLLLNGKEIESLTPFNEETGIIGWDVPFSPGVLTAEGCDMSGSVLSDFSIETTGRPYALRVTTDSETLAVGGALAILTVEVVDDEGRVVRLADNEVTCTVEGVAGEFLGLEAGDIADMSSYNDNVHRVFYGRIVSYVRSTGSTGDVRVRFTSPLLKGAEVTLAVE
ncbi:MAG: glycoside hydrolase family 2 TIM barrel-domain containing protein [Rikenellaceae bacterium]